MSATDPRHGTINGYAHKKCRCPGCRKAWAVYQRAAYLRRRSGIRYARAPVGSPGDFIVFTELHLKPSGNYGIERQMVTARTADEAIAMSGLDPTLGLAAFSLPSEAEYLAALAAELEQHHRTA